MLEEDRKGTEATGQRFGDGGRSRCWRRPLRRRIRLRWRPRRRWIRRRRRRRRRGLKNGWRQQGGYGGSASAVAAWDEDTQRGEGRGQAAGIEKIEESGGARETSFSEDKGKSGQRVLGRQAKCGREGQGIQGQRRVSESVGRLED